MRNRCKMPIDDIFGGQYDRVLLFAAIGILADIPVVTLAIAIDSYQACRVLLWLLPLAAIVVGGVCLCRKSHAVTERELSFSAQQGEQVWRPISPEELLRLNEKLSHRGGLLAHLLAVALLLAATVGILQLAALDTTYSAVCWLGFVLAAAAVLLHHVHTQFWQQNMEQASVCVLPVYITYETSHRSRFSESISYHAVVIYGGKKYIFSVSEHKGLRQLMVVSLGRFSWVVPMEAQID